MESNAEHQAADGAAAAVFVSSSDIAIPPHCDDLSPDPAGVRQAPKVKNLLSVERQSLHVAGGGDP